ncbi:unnamed protein product [marine sediment metagenome]|uniref:HK97 gp10 family phage protein n=1 Tax=marine sediment metagenome TaxID=412755 RepID=X0TX45_9ZZZZ
MAVQLRVSVVGTEELKRRLAKMDPGANKRILTKSLTDAAQLISKDVKEVQIVTGRTKAPPLPDKLTNRHGGSGLVGSIGVNRQPLPFAVEVGTHLTYGAIHEEGRGNYPRRPFLQPALDKIAPKFGSIVVKHWKREAGL